MRNRTRITLGSVLLLAAVGFGSGAAVAQTDLDPPPDVVVAQPSNTDVAPPQPKWFVCKYTFTPGGGEVLQTGQNPISVSENAFPAGVIPAVGVEFNDAQGRSLIIAEDTGQPEPPTRDDCPPPNPPPTTTTMPSSSSSSSSSSTSSSTTSTSTTTTIATTTTTGPTPTLFAIEVTPVCPDGTAPLIAITFGDRPDLDGQTGTLSFSTGGSIPLTFESLATVDVPYPASAGTGPVTMTYTLGAESVTRSTTFPEACTPATTTTTTTVPGTPTTAPTTTVPGTPTTPAPGAPTVPPTVPFTFGAAASVCVREVPFIRIEFQNTFPDLAGHVGTLTMADINGNIVSTQPLAYEPGTTVDLLYPGTAVNPDGTIDDVPGWILTDDGFWIRDPSDAFLREGITLTYTVNPTATAFVTYPPESSTCANPAGPFPPDTTAPEGGLPPTGSDSALPLGLAAVALGAGGLILLTTRRRRTT